MTRPESMLHTLLLSLGSLVVAEVIQSAAITAVGDFGADDRALDCFHLVIFGGRCCAGDGLRHSLRQFHAVLAAVLEP